MHAGEFTFQGSRGGMLAGLLNMPAATPRAAALFAHCFTCGKDIPAARIIAETLVAQGIAVLRFDFTGLGGSEGEFANTNFSSNIDDLIAAAAHLRARGLAPQLLIGHSLGGAAVLAAAQRIPESRAVVTIAAPSDPGHVVHLLSDHVETIAREGEAAVMLAGRPFTVRKQFLEDISSVHVKAGLGTLRRALLVMHAPTDQTVGIENAFEIFQAAKHPKSFVALDGADHLLRRRQDAAYAARTLACWAERYLEAAPSALAEGEVEVSETGGGLFQQSVALDGHHLIADEPKRAGGLGSGPSPYEFLLAGLGACTAMTLRLYAGRKNIPLEHVDVTLRHTRVHGEDAAGETPAALERIEREIRLTGELSEEQRARLMQIADRCPVHRTLTGRLEIVTRETAG